MVNQHLNLYYRTSFRFCNTANFIILIKRFHTIKNRQLLSEIDKEILKWLRAKYIV